MLVLNYQSLFYNFNIFLKDKFFLLFTRYLLKFSNFLFLKLKTENLFLYFNNLLSFNLLFDYNQPVFKSLFVSVDYIKVQELGFLSEYFLITAIFCLTLFALFSVKVVALDKNKFSIKFQYNNQLIFLVIFILTCYLVLVYQQLNFSVLNLLSFNDSIVNDSLAITAKFIIGFSSLCYLIFIIQYLKDQKLSNFEYYILLLTSIFGFFLICSTNDFITAYLAIELQGLAFYVLAAFKKSSNFSVESGIKYFVIGSLSTALFLFGITFVYGFSGSLILTDFNDFFLWTFSTSSLFFSFESLEKLFNTESLSNEKLQTISDSLDVIKKKFYDLKFDFQFLKPVFLETNELSKITLCKDIFNKMFETYYQMEFTNFISKNQLQANYIISSFNTFLIEDKIQNLHVEFLYNLNRISNVSFEDFKNNLIEANYYEFLKFNHFDQFGLESSDLIENSSSFFKLSDTLSVSHCFENVYQLLECCYFSECLLGLAQYSEYLKTNNGILNEKVFKAFELTSSDFISFLKNSDLNFDNLFELQSYEFSVMNILSLNSFFLEFSDLNSNQNLFLIDLSFVIFGLIIIFLALLFKLALAPFHAWSPDVYEGSPTSSTFFFMVISKLGIFIFLIRLCYSSFYSFMSYWQFYSILVATISIFIGAAGGLKQRKLKSLLTYSSINNMGFVLLAFSVGSFEGVQIKFYYLIVYMLTSLCVWGIILNLKLKKKMYFEKQNRDLGDLALLQESNKVIAQNLAITLFSMAGLPPMVGFLAKMAVFKALAGVSIYFFSVINILFSVIATFYYLRVIKIIFFENLLVGNLYASINSKNVFLINFLNFLIVFLFISPMFLYLYSYKITLFIDKGFY